jgi:hypothetical protein
MDSLNRREYNFYTNLGEIKSVGKTMGMGAIYLKGAMPPVNLDPATGKNMTPMRIVQEHVVTC